MATALSSSLGPMYCRDVYELVTPQKCLKSCRTTRTRANVCTRVRAPNANQGHCHAPLPSPQPFSTAPARARPAPGPEPRTCQPPAPLRHACEPSQWPFTSAVRCLAEASWAMLVLLGVYLMAKYTARTNVAMYRAANLCASQPAYYHAPCNGKSRGKPGRRAARCDSSCRAPRHESL